MCAVHAGELILLWWLLFSHLASCEQLASQEVMATPAAMMKATELDALFQLIESLLEVPTNFRASHPRLCTQDLLQGMECERGGDKLMHVTRLQFGSGMRKRCKAAATLPSDAIGQLPFLKTLLVSECIMNQRSTIPTKLTSSLQELSLRSNKALVGSIPAELGQLRNLQVLSLAQNDLRGDIPEVLGDLQMLEHLDLSYNMLSGKLPPMLGQLPRLSILDFSGNALQGSIPASFSSLKSLQKLDLSSNQLKGTIPMELGNLANLQFLALSQNGFVGPLPSSLEKLSNLQYFLLDSNPIHGSLPSYISRWTQLRELNLANSYYAGPIPADLGKTLFNVSVINLSNNKLQGTIPPSLENMQHISYLNLSQNLLTGAVPFSERFLQKLGNRLDLHGNPALCIDAASISFSDALLAQQIHPCGSNNKPGQLAAQHLHQGSPSTVSNSARAGVPPSLGFTLTYSLRVLYFLLAYGLFLVFLPY
ncbi:hypothetical protein KP509_27G029700 [Ceratopteris richardii]|uniref:Uncharacterized protein n=4 Tax=Ceratopteris richardii TaxID=49495 RepID=A0A8T2RGU3_CERRI|nr:hypothetical protein KP509_27G029700 [Ceratopteris richardii]